MKKILNILAIISLSFMFTGCGGFLLFAGAATGMVYVADDINTNYDGDGVEYIKDKSSKAYDGLRGE